MTHSIGTALQQFFNESGFHLHQTDRSNCIALYSGQHGKFAVVCQIRGKLLYFLSILPVTIPQDKQSNVLDYLNSLNWQTAVGNFEMDPSGGEGRFRTSLDCADDTLTPRMIGALLYRNLFMCDRSLPGLLRILFANANPLDAIQAVAATDDDNDEEPDADDLDELLSDVNLDQLPKQGDD